MPSDTLYAEPLGNTSTNFAVKSVWGEGGGDVQDEFHGPRHFQIFFERRCRVDQDILSRFDLILRNDSRSRADHP